MNTDIIHKEYFISQLNTIRLEFISLLYKETIQSVESKNSDNLIIYNWCSEDAKALWISDCDQCKKNNAICIWLRCYIWRHNQHLATVVKQYKNTECPVRDISAFLLLDMDKNGFLSNKAKNGLFLLLDLINVWLWLVDEINGTLHLYASAPFLYTNEATEKFMGNFKIPIGKGLTGYALSKNKGICMTDTVTDVRGTAIFRNIVSRRFSYIGIPIKDESNTSHTIKDKIIAYVGLTFPVLHAWHPSKRFCNYIMSGNRNNNTCFYKKFESFLNQDRKSCTHDHSVKNLTDDSDKGFNYSIKYGCKSLLRDRLYRKLYKSTKISNSKPEFNDLLRNLCSVEDINNDALGINYASLWELNGSGDFIMRDEVFSKEIAFTHFAKRTIHENRYKHQEGQFVKHFTRDVQKKIVVELSNPSIPGQLEKYAVFEITLKVDLKENEKERIKEVVNSYGKNLHEIVNLMSWIMDIGLSIYRNAHPKPSDLRLDRLDILKRKLIKDLCKIFLKNWCTKKLPEFDIFGSAYYDFKHHLCHQWETDGYLTHQEKEAILLLMEKNIETSENLTDQINKIIPNEQYLDIHLWINLTSLFHNKMGYVYQIPHVEKNNTFILSGCKDKKNHIRRDLVRHTSFKPLDYMINYKHEGDIIDIREHDLIISNRWSCIFSYFNYVSFVEFGNGDHRCGFLYNGTKKEAEAFYIFLKKIILEKQPDKWNTIIQCLRNDERLQSEKNSFLLFHVKKFPLWYYVYISENKSKKFFHSMIDSNSMNRMLKSIFPTLKKINKNEIIHKTNGVPLFFWNIYQNEGKGSWELLIGNQNTCHHSPENSSSALNETFLNLIGCHSLFVYLFEELRQPAILLIGRSLLNAEYPKYSAFNDNQSDIISVFHNIAEGWLKYEEYYKTGEIKNIVGSSLIVKCLREYISKAARLPWPVLIIGETGTGKEIAAKAMHDAGPRKDGPFIAVNCGGMTESLIESEFFGYSDGGVFTGASKKGRKGKFEEANHGTIFLDEIGNAPYKLQTSLLRVLETGTVMPVGSNREIRVNVRVICATNIRLIELKSNKSIREDLLNRISSLIISVPPLRERKDDILPLAENFLKKFNEEINAFNKQDNLEISISNNAIALLKHWEYKEGNIRELRNILQRAVMMSGKTKGILTEKDIERAISFGQSGLIQITSNHLRDLLENNYLEYAIQSKGMKDAQKMKKMDLDKETLKEKEKICYEKLLVDAGKITKLAKQLNISRDSLTDKLNYLGLSRKWIT